MTAVEKEQRVLIYHQQANHIKINIFLYLILFLVLCRHHKDS
jgi:hypothetical protein